MFGGGTKTAWQQNAVVVPNQIYYFSAWFAKYAGGGWVGTLRFQVKGNKESAFSTVGTAKVKGATVVWQQFNGQWYSSNKTSAVIRNVFVVICAKEM